MTVMRSSRGGWVAAAVVLMSGAGCSPRPATALVLSLSAEPLVPSELSKLDVSAYRGGKVFSNSYDLTREKALPGTLTFVDEDGGDDDPLLIDVVATSPDGQHSIKRTARIRLVNEKTKLLSARFEYACLDVKCQPEQSCSAGQCVSFDVSADALPDFAGNDAALSQTGCFDERRCLTAAAPATVSEGSCTFSAPGPAGAFNVAMTWRVSPSNPVVLEPTTGYTVDAGLVRLAPGYCSALASGSALSVSTSTACPTKAPGGPVCEQPPTSGGGAGAGGGVGAGGLSGLAGVGGTSAMGGAGNAGAGGVPAVGGAGGASGMGGAAGMGGLSGMGGASGTGGLAGMGGLSGMSGAGGTSGMGGGGLGGGAGAAGAAGQPAAGSSLAAASSAYFERQVDGTLLAWGYHYNQNPFGDRRPGVMSAKPAVVPGIDSVSHVTSGSAHCVLRAGGLVTCWGDSLNDLGPGADGSPIAIPLPKPARQIVAVIGATCALLENDEAWCWGSNSSGNVGAGDSAMHLAPLKVLEGVKTLWGTGFVCATRLDDTLWCWGDDVSNTPVQIAAQAPRSVDTWSGVWVVTSQGVDFYTSASMWMASEAFALGGIDPATIERVEVGPYEIAILAGGSVAFAVDKTFTPVDAGGVVTDIVIGSSFPYKPSGCVIVDGVTRCWGIGSLGELGDGLASARLTATKVPAVAAIEAAAWDSGVVAVTTAGSLVRWGKSGAFGPPTVSPTPAPEAGADLVATALGSDGSGSSYVIHQDNSIDAFRDGAKLTTDQTLAGATAQTAFSQIFSGGMFDIGLTVGGDVVVRSSCTDPEAYFLGNGVTSVTPGLAATAFTGALEISAWSPDYPFNAHRACARTATEVHCWGNAHMGNGVGGPSAVPVKVAYPADGAPVTSVCSSYNYDCAVRGGTPSCWGDVPWASTVTSPTPLTADTAWHGVACSDGFACAWKADGAGTIGCVGSNEWGQLGVGKRSIAETFTTWQLGEKVKRVVSHGGRFSCALAESGAVYCWGNDTFGEQGSGKGGPVPFPGVKVAKP